MYKSMKKCAYNQTSVKFFETFIKWPKWQDVSVDIKILSPGGCLPLPRGYIHLLNHKKMCVKSEVEVMRPFCWHQNFGPDGLTVPAKAIYIYIYKIMKKMCIKRYFWNMQPVITVIRSFCFHWKHCPQGLSALMGLYIHVWSYKIMRWKGSFWSCYKMMG